MTPSYVGQNQYSATKTSNDGTWPQSYPLLIDPQHKYRQDDFNKPPNSSMDHFLDLSGGAERTYETWQSDLTEHDRDGCDPTTYEPVVEDLNKMDAFVLASEIHSFENSPDDTSYLPDIVGRSEEQFPYAAPQISTSTGSSKDSLAPISPISNDEAVPEASKATPATTTMQRPSLDKSPDQTRMDHSVVEKKYRDNLNAKFWDLQQCVPTLQVGSDEKSGPRGSGAVISGSGKAAKLQKGEIISRAVNYIRTSSARTSSLETHIELLDRRLVVLQRIALQKTKRVDHGLNTADSKSHRVPAVTKPMSLISPLLKCLNLLVG